MVRPGSGPAFAGNSDMEVVLVACTGHGQAVPTPLPRKRGEGWADPAVCVQIWLPPNAVLPRLIEFFGGNVCG